MLPILLIVLSTGANSPSCFMSVEGLAFQFQNFLFSSSFVLRQGTALEVITLNVLGSMGGVSCLSSCCHILQGIGGEQAGVALAVICPEA